MQIPNFCIGFFYNTHKFKGFIQKCIPKVLQAPKYIEKDLKSDKTIKLIT